ncbi:MAG: hypothetical protein NZ602_17060 [Thermoguttaceae bacterium]|nr:hypothetical protein [Thermoguttaceae bacterium]
MDFIEYVECPFCGFDHMEFSGGDHGSYAEYWFEMYCPICGFARWTDGKDPDLADVEWAKEKVKELTPEEVEQITDLFKEDGVPLVKKFRENI